MQQLGGARVPAVPGRTTATFAALLALAALAGCGKGAATGASSGGGPIVQVAPVAPQGAVSLVTRNTTRVGGSTPVEDAAAVARTVYPALTGPTRPRAVVIVDAGNWPAALAASSLAASPLGAPIIFSEGGELPSISEQTVEELKARGVPALGGAGVITIGSSRAPQGFAAHNVPFESPATGAAQIASLLTKLVGRPQAVIVVPLGAPASQTMAFAGLAAESATPILYSESSGLPSATSQAISALGHPTIYVAAASYMSSSARSALARLGTVKTITPGQSQSPAEASVAVARYGDGGFGWGIHEPGHGLVFARSSRALDGPAAALLSATGSYGPLLLLESAAALPTPLATYLSDIQPAYSTAPEYRPVRGVYNHGWVIGDGSAIATTTQAEIDTLLEITARHGAGEETSAPAGESETTTNP